MNGYKIVLLKAILCFIGCRKVNGYAPEYVGLNTITLTLLNVKTLILPQGSITVHDYKTGDYREMNICAILTEDNPDFSINLEKIINPNEFCVISILSKKYYCPLFSQQTII